jgi:hypothetical protein
MITPSDVKLSPPYRQHADQSRRAAGGQAISTGLIIAMKKSQSDGTGRAGPFCRMQEGRSQQWRAMSKSDIACR